MERVPVSAPHTQLPVSLCQPTALKRRSPKCRLRVCLRGQGIAPTLSVTPPTATAAGGGLAFGDVLLSDPVCKELKVQVTNTCPFTINYSTRFIGPAPPQQPQQAAATAGSKSRPASATGAKLAGSAPAAAAAGPGGPVKQTALGGVVVQQQGTAAAAAPGAKPAGVAPAGTAAAAAGASAAAAGAAAAPVSPPAAATAEAPGMPSGCFVCRPSGGVLLAGQTQELTVVFAPLGTPGAGMQGSRGPCGPLSPYVSDRLQVLVPHQQQDVVVPLSGSAWPDGVFVSGPVYKSSSSGGSAAGHTAVAQPAAGAAWQDPFAAILVAAAAAAAPPAAAPTSAGAAASAGSAQGAGAKGRQAASQQQGKQGAQPLGAGLQPRDVQAALAAAGYRDLTQGYVTLPGPVSAGQVSSVTVDFGSIKSSAGGAAGELVVEELPPEANEAGWSVDPVKVSAPAGEKRPLTVRFSAPAAAKLGGTALGALGQLQLAVQQTVRLGVVMKGGCQGPTAAVAADGTRRMTLVCSCMLAPAPAQAAEALAAAVPTAAAGVMKK